MRYLIEYNRKEGKIVTFQVYTEDQKEEADEIRFKKELDNYRNGIINEVIVLAADSEEQLRTTHGRYFYTYEELIEKLNTGLEKSLRSPLYQKALKWDRWFQLEEKELFELIHLEHQKDNLILLDALKEVMTNTEEWLTQPNQALNNRKPQELIDEYDHEPLWHMVHALKSGEPS